MIKGWIAILLGGIVEVAWVTGLKHADNWVQWALTIVCIIFSFTMMIIAVKWVPVGTAYAIFTGMGTVGTVIIGILLFHEPVSIMKIAFLLLLVIGVIGLKLQTTEDKEEGEV